MSPEAAELKKLAPTTEGRIVAAYLDHKIVDAKKTLCDGTKEEFEANQARLHTLEAMRELLG